MAEGNPFGLLTPKDFIFFRFPSTIVNHHVYVLWFTYSQRLCFFRFPFFWWWVYLMMVNPAHSIVTIQKRDGLHLFSICLFNVDLTLPLTLPCTVLRQGLLQPWRMGWINHHQVHSSSKERKSKKTKSFWVSKPRRN
jgi:hypothetical protein